MSYYDNKNKQKFDGLIVKFSYKELKKIFQVKNGKVGLQKGAFEKIVSLIKIKNAEKIREIYNKCNPETFDKYKKEIVQNDLQKHKDLSKKNKSKSLALPNYRYSGIYDYLQGDVDGKSKRTYTCYYLGIKISSLASVSYNKYINRYLLGNLESRYVKSIEYMCYAKGNTLQNEELDFRDTIAKSQSRIFDNSNYSDSEYVNKQCIIL